MENVKKTKREGKEIDAQVQMSYNRVSERVKDMKKKLSNVLMAQEVEIGKHD